jgi:hypothetical protein
MFETLKLRYERNFVRMDQLRQYVLLGRITAQQFETITQISY